MAVVSNDTSLWPLISLNIFQSYWFAAAGVVVAYDWVLTLGQEIELIWRQRWSLMTVLYLVIRYIGIPYSVINALPVMPMVPLNDTGCIILFYTTNGTNIVVVAMLCTIMIARLHAMYQRSRIMLVFLVIFCLAINIACGAITAIGLKDTVGGEDQIFSGIYTCYYEAEGDVSFLESTVWILNIVWEVLALCLSVWIAVKNFRGLRRLSSSAGSTIEDCFRVLIKSHVLYFASFAGVSCLQLVTLSLNDTVGDETLYGVSQILSGVQMFVLGPRLILSVREYHTKLVADSDVETSMNSIVFQERVHVSTSSTV